MERTSDSREDLTSNHRGFHNDRFSGKPTMKVFADCGDEFWSFLEKKLRKYCSWSAPVIRLYRESDLPITGE